jgi:hypothetical protein
VLARVPIIATKRTHRVNVLVNNATVTKLGPVMTAPLVSLAVELTVVAMELVMVKEIVTVRLDGMHHTAPNHLHARLVAPTEEIAFSANASAVLGSLALDANSTPLDAIVLTIATTTDSAWTATRQACALATDCEPTIAISIRSYLFVCYIFIFRARGFLLVKHSWAGNDCSQPDPLCPNHCSDHGSCVNHNCSCQDGWTGTDCAISTLGCPNNCSLNGICRHERCTCLLGWKVRECVSEFVIVRQRVMRKLFPCQNHRLA